MKKRKGTEKKRLRETLVQRLSRLKRTSTSQKLHPSYTSTWTKRIVFFRKTSRITQGTCTRDTRHVRSNVDENTSLFKLIAQILSVTNTACNSYELECAILSIVLTINSGRGRHGLFFVQDLGLALVANTYPTTTGLQKGQ